MNNSRWQDSESLTSFWSVIGLGHDPLSTFGEMWYHVFLWSLLTWSLVSLLSSAIAFKCFHRHPTARWAPLLLLLSGVLPLVSFAITSAAVAGVYTVAEFYMHPIYAMFWGVGQVVVTIFFSFSRVLATL